MRTERRSAAPRQMAHRVSRSERVRGAAAGSGAGSAAHAAARTVAALRRNVAAMSPKRLGLIAAGVTAALVAAIGVFSPAAAGTGPGPGSAPSAGQAAASTAPSIVGSAWGGAGGIDLLDLITKGALVLVLLFITLRVLGRMQSAGGPRRGGRLNVLESRPLASKASLHLVAVGDRRLVVGLTPNGIVALAELDAAELETAEAGEAEASPAGEAEAGPDGAAPRRAARPQLPAGQLPFASTLNALLAPIDGFADRLAGKLGGSRIR